jgi:hypothetical protein
MNKPLILITLLLLLSGCMTTAALAGSTQTNTSGSNTADFGMKVAAVAILCQDERVFESMIQAGTPCPIDGKIGKEAKKLWSKYDHERPDYKTYVKRMDDRKKADEKEQKKIKAEIEAANKAKAEEDRKKANAEKMKDWKHPR